MNKSKLDNEPEAVRAAIREGYGKIAGNGGSCCGSTPSSCRSIVDSEQPARHSGYSAVELAALPEGADMGHKPDATTSTKPTVRLEVYDTAMCCSTGVCGPEIDPVLVRFAADLKWLQEQDAEVQRFNLSQSLAAFVENEQVKQALTDRGETALPMILAGGRVMAHSIATGEVWGEVIGTGTLNTNFKAVASPKVIQGRLVQVLAYQNDFVANSQLLAVLDDSEQRRQVEMAQATLDAAPATVRRVWEDEARAQAVLRLSRAG